MWLVIDLVREALVILNYNFRDTISKRFFKISTVVITLLLLLIFILPDFILNSELFNESKEYLFYIVDNKNYIFNNHLDLNMYANDMSSLLDGKYFFHLVDEEMDIYSIDKELEKGIINGYLVVNSEDDVKIVANNNYSDLKFLIDRYIISNRLVNENRLYDYNLYVNYDLVSSATIQDEFGNILQRYMIPSILTIFLYVIFIIYGQSISTSVNIEKNSKITEIVLTKAKVLNIILGRVIGVLIACMLQLIYFLIVLFLIVSLLSVEYFPTVKSVVDLEFILVVRYVLYFALGFIFYGLVFMLIGSIVNKTEDLPMGLIPVTFLISIGSVVLFIGIQFPQSGLAFISKYIPFFMSFSIISNISVSLLSEVFMVGIMIASIVILVIFNVNAIKSTIKFKGNTYRQRK